jgi:protein tyrosine/serine phosphatase
MASPFKEPKRWLTRESARVVARATSTAPERGRSLRAAALCYADMLFVDFGIIRQLTHNKHKISDDVWRSGQPSPHHIRGFASKGVKTIINLRSDQSAGTRWLQEQACKRFSIKLLNVHLRSRSAPTRDELLRARDAITRAQYPVLLHCKSGADRAGLMSVLLLHERYQVPIAEARRQLSLRYGHIRQANTGVLDAVFDRYVLDSAKDPIEFWDWVEKRYDPKDIEQTFKSSPWASRFVDSVLRRE